MKKIANQFSTGSTIEKVAVGDDQKAMKALSKKWWCGMIKKRDHGLPRLYGVARIFFAAESYLFRPDGLNGFR